MLLLIKVGEMDSPKKSEPADEIGEIDPMVIGEIVARHCPNSSPSEILRLVMDVLARKALGDGE